MALSSGDVELSPAEVATRSAAAMHAADRASVDAGIRLVLAGPQRAVTALTVAKRHVNGHGICHGGYLFMLADTAFAYACNSAGVATVAAGCDISFLAPAPLGAELTAHAELRASTGRSGIYDVTVRMSDQVVAEFRGRSRTVPGLTPPPQDPPSVAGS